MTNDRAPRDGRSHPPPSPKWKRWREGEAEREGEGTPQEKVLEACREQCSSLVGVPPLPVCGHNMEMYTLRDRKRLSVLPGQLEAQSKLTTHYTLFTMATLCTQTDGYMVNRRSNTRNWLLLYTRVAMQKSWLQIHYNYTIALHLFATTKLSALCTCIHYSYLYYKFMNTPTLGYKA